MVNELRALLHDNVASPPPDDGDLSAVLNGGRRQVRRRRMVVVAGMAAATAAVVGLTVLVSPGDRGLEAADGVPRPDAPTMRLAEAKDAVEGRDYRLLATHTNENLERDSGQYFDGVTDDGLILFRDGPHGMENLSRFALMDPETGAKDWLPEGDLGHNQAWPVELGRDRLVLVSSEYTGELTSVRGHVFDRSTRKWSTIKWPGLPKAEEMLWTMGSDGRLYVSVQTRPIQVPAGGWPMEDGEADDSNAGGQEFRLWSVSLADPDDVRDEELTVGAVAFTDDAMVWSGPDVADGNGKIHVRSLETGEERSFDPDSGERCNLLGFGASGDRIVLSQYCGDYGEGNDTVRDDRVQILSTDGEQVQTIQDSGLDGGLAGGGNAVTIEAYERGTAGTYVYDLRTDRLLRLSDAISSHGMGGPTSGDTFLWHTPVGKSEDSTVMGRGAKQWLGELIR